MGYSAQSVGQWQTWTPTFTGFSADPTSITARYSLDGKRCTVMVHMTAGTSNATTFTLTLPFSASLLGHATACVGTDNGTNQNSWVRTRANSNILDCYRTVATTTWTASGSKAIFFTLTYEIA